MINFRYHVVSLTAVFLALAIGLVVGTAALNGPLADSLNDRVNALSQQNQQYREQVGHLEQDVNQKEQFATAAAPYMLQGKLTGRRVLLLSLPSASKYVDGVRDMLTTAGAKVTGQVEVEDKFTDPASNETLLDLAHTSLPPGVNPPTNSDGVETSSALLAAALLDHSPALAADASKAVLTAYREERFITVTGDVTGPAEAVVLLVGAPYTDREAQKKNAAVVTMADQFDQAGPIVVGSDSAAGTDNVVAALRDDPTLSKTVSTVDNISTVQGRVVVPLVCAEQLRGKAGAYGVGAGATALMPKLTQGTG
ncbi:MAG TPA: copper transporter [Micromonosporaceae bacterium]